MSTSTSLAVGVLQLDGRNGSRQDRIDDARESMRSASRRLDALDASYRLLVLPELWATGFFNFDDYAPGAEPLDGPLVRTIRAQATTAGAWVVGGSVIERGPSGLHNTTVVADDAGALITTYRKIHLFGYRSREAELLQAGDRPVVFDGPCGRIGVMTCYDLRFPELARDLACRGAQVIVIVSAWPAARIAHWRTLLRARAIENQLWVIAANASGVDAGVPLGGHSAVTAPDGEIVTEADNGECVLTESIDVAATDITRDALPFAADNRYSVHLRRDE